MTFFILYQTENEMIENNIDAILKVTSVKTLLLLDVVGMVATQFTVFLFWNLDQRHFR